MYTIECSQGYKFSARYPEVNTCVGLVFANSFGGIGGDGEKKEVLALVSTRGRAFFWPCLV
jgi:hypothetical protein